MPLADAPLTAEVLEAVRHHWLVSGDHGERLRGGEESASYRVGEYVLRIGPGWRADAELEWCHAVASQASLEVPEVVAPRPTRGGATVVRVEGRPVSVWPFVAGTWGDDTDPRQRSQAADLLARLHRSAAGLPIVARPPGGPKLACAPELADPALDAWLIEFDTSHPARQPLHGDYYAGNVLVDRGRIAALLDWDDAFVGAPERELAWAAWEWGDGLWTLELDAAKSFVSDYKTAGGPAAPVSEGELRQLVRQRIRWEVRYARVAREGAVLHDAADLDYEAQQLEAFRILRPWAPER